MSQVSADSDAVRQALTDLRKPLVRQGLLLVPLAVDIIVLVIRGEPARVGGYYLSGLALVVFATVLAFWVTSRPLPTWVVAAVPLLDIAAIGLMRLVPDGNGLGVLCVLPAMWLAADHRMRGVAYALVGTVALVSVPSLTYFGMEASWWSRALMQPTIVGMVAITVAGTAQIWERQNKELEEQGDRLETALADMLANRALSEAIVSTVDVGLVALDREGRFRAVNPRQLEFMALAFPDGHQGRAGQVGEVFGPDRVTPLARDELPTARAMNHEAFTDYVIWFGKDPGEQKALSVSASPVRDSAGRFDGAVLVYKDITELWSALKVKDDFVASVSHELRTPLTSIMGFLELVLDEESVDPVVRQQLLVVKRNSDRLLRLVSDLLLAAQVKEGRLSIEVVPMDLAALAQHALGDLGPRAASEQLQLVADIPEHLRVTADPTRIRQTLDNLLSNAIKYTPPGGTVTLSLRRHGEEVELEVRDTGIGIADDEVGRLFTRFYRTQDAQLRAIQGIGLGLAITKAIVDAHHGRIEVASVAGAGTTFRVHLPVAGPTLVTNPVPPLSAVHRRSA